MSTVSVVPGVARLAGARSPWRSVFQRRRERAAGDLAHRVAILGDRVALPRRPAGRPTPVRRGRGRAASLDPQQGVAAGEVVADQVAGESQPGLEGIDLLAQFVAVQRHSRFQPQRVAGRQPAGTMPQRLALVDDGLPDGRGDFRADAQFEAVFAGVAGAADDAALPLGGRVQHLHRRAAVVAHPLQVDVHQRLQDLDALAALGWRTWPTAG